MLLKAVPTKINNEATTENSENTFCQVNIVIGISKIENIIETTKENLSFLKRSIIYMVIKNKIDKKTAREAVNPPSNKKCIPKQSLFKVFKSTIQFFFFARYVAE